VFIKATVLTGSNRYDLAGGKQTATVGGKYLATGTVTDECNTAGLPAISNCEWVYRFIFFNSSIAKLAARAVIAI